MLPGWKFLRLETGELVVATLQVPMTDDVRWYDPEHSSGTTARVHVVEIRDRKGGAHTRALPMHKEFWDGTEYIVGQDAVAATCSPRRRVACMQFGINFNVGVVDIVSTLNEFVADPHAWATARAVIPKRE